MNVIRIWVTCVVIALVGTGWAVRLHDESRQEPPPAPPSRSTQMSPHTSFFGDYEYFLRTGNLPGTVYTTDPIGAPFK